MIYEYECNNCGHTCEVEQKITDKPRRKCQKCKKLALKRLISSTSFQLVGTGWFNSGGY